MDTSSPRPGVIIATAASGTLAADDVDSFRRSFLEIFHEQKGVKTIILDLSAITFIDSSGLGTLVALLKRATEQDCDIKLAGLSKEVRLLFEITKTYRIFDIFDSSAEALATLA